MPGRKIASCEVDGTAVLYHFLEKELRVRNVWLFQMLAAELVARLGIWLSPDIYRQMPVLLPFAARDPHARGNTKLGIPDQWGAPDSNGIFRDDNSLIKSIPRSLKIDSSSTAYRGRRLGKGFTAAHVWRIEDPPGGESHKLLARDPLLYSFVPNLVWLPAQVAKLTDREGSFTQVYLQALSAKIYGELPLSLTVQQLVDPIWERLRKPTEIPQNGLPDVSELSFFATSSDFVERRKKTVQSVASALGRVASGRVLDRKVVSSRYTEGLSRLPADSAAELALTLKAYLAAVGIGDAGAEH